jgi:hypothetical protein
VLPGRIIQSLSLWHSRPKHALVTYSIPRPRRRHRLGWA